MRLLPSSVRARMLLRSFAVQGSWNYETLIGAGFAFSLLPALRYIHGNDDESLDAAVKRHAELFNSHPYFSTVAIGAVARLEAEGVEPAVIDRFKTALRGSLGSLGDRLIWGTWRPMSVVLGLVFLLAGAAWWLAIGVFLVVYNAAHLRVRFTGLRIGSDAGLEVGRVLREAPLQKAVTRASRIACVVIGVAIVLIAAPVADDPRHLILIATGVALGYALGTRTRRAMIGILAGAAAFALVLGFIGNGA